MSVKTKVSKAKSRKEFAKECLESIENDLKEIDGIGVEEVLSVWAFFKYLISEPPELEKGDRKVFVTPRTSIIYQNKDLLEKNCKNVEIRTMEEMVAG